MEEFDPSRATIGIWNRQAWTGAVKRPEELDLKPTYKYAEELEMPPDPAIPQFPEPKPGGADPDDTERDIPTDLNVHNASVPKADNVRNKIRALRAQVINKEKRVLQKQVAKQNQDHQNATQGETDIEVDRSEIEPHVPNMRKGAQDPLSELADSDANPIRLMLILDTQWGPEWKSWEAETIAETSEVDIARVNMDKLMAIKNLTNTGEFWEDPNVFSKVCLAFAGRMVDWGHVQEPRLHEIAACVSLVERYISELGFSDDVAAYVAAAGVRDGYILLPPVLSFANGPFSLELAMNIGDQVIGQQEELRAALDAEDAEILKSADAIQYMRLLRCQYHTQDMIDTARA